MKVLFFMRNFSGYFRQFEPALRELLDRGHQVHVARDRGDGMDSGRWAGALQEAYGDLFTFDFTPHPQQDPWYQFKRNVRLSRDYLHFLGPEFDEAPEFVSRARKRAPDSVVRAFEPPRMRTASVRRAASSALYLAEDAAPVDSTIQGYIAEHAPHIVLLTPHLMPGSLQTEYLRAAKSLGLRTALCVASWDNLSSKQIIRVVPDVVTVWNDTQVREALEIHDLPEERLAVTGAQVYDHWFDWKPRPRARFSDRVGLPPDRPYLLYVGGALFPAEITEAQHVVRWLSRLRESDHPELRDIHVLIRPHPKRVEEWRAVNIDEVTDVTLWPRIGTMPVAQDAKADFYDSIYHSATVVGVNTSAMIEAGIVGRRVHTLLVPEFSGSQQGTLHFRYLTEIGGGLLRVASDYPDHLSQLAEAVRQLPDEENPNRAFIEAFIRPQGIENPAAPLFADAIERTASAGPAHGADATPVERVMRRVLRPVADRMGAAARIGFEQKQARKQVSAERDRQHRSEREQNRALHAKRKADKAARRAAKEAAQAARESMRSAEPTIILTGIEGPGRPGEDDRALTSAEDGSSQNGRDPLDDARDRVRNLAGSDKPVMAGPFLGSAEAELLYWIPFLTWVVGEYGDLGPRMTIIGRPERRSWYEHLSPTWCDVPPELQAAVGYGAPGNGSGDVVGRLMRQLGLPENSEPLLPGTVRAAAAHLLGRGVLSKPKRKSIFRYERMRTPDPGILEARLPSRYVAVDLAFDWSLPDLGANARFIDSTLRDLCTNVEVVLLRAPPFDSLPDGVVTLDPAVLPADRGAIEMAIAGSAEQFIGTLGGRALLAPFLGVPAIAVYDRDIRPEAQELALASTVLGQGGLGGFRALATDDEAAGELALNRSALVSS